MKQALGLVEIEGLTMAVVVADTMAKAANVRILELENTKGLGYMTIKIAGDVGAVNAAVTAGKQIGMINQKLISWKVIPRPSDYVEQTFCQPGQPDLTSSGGQNGQEKGIAEVKKETVAVKAEAELSAEPDLPEPEVSPEPEAVMEPAVSPEPETAPEAEVKPEKSGAGKKEAAAKETGTKKRKK